MISYNDKIDASYAKLKTVLAGNASAVVGFKSSLQDKSKIMTRKLSEEIVQVLLSEIQSFVMHMTSASIDQASGRLQRKLQLLNEDGLMLSDETVQKIKDALSEIPGASSSVAQLLNGICKGRRLDDLSDFFSVKPGGERESEDKGEDVEDSRLLSKDAQEEFAKYLDQTLPKTKYFNAVFQQAFDAIDRVFDRVEGVWNDIRLANVDLLNSNTALADSTLRLASSVASIASSNLLLASSNTSLAASIMADAVATAALAASTAVLAIVNFALAITTLTAMVFIAAALISATLSAISVTVAAAVSLIAAVFAAALSVTLSVLALVFTVALSAVSVILSVLASAAIVIVAVIVATVALIVSILAVALTVLISALIITVAIVALAVAFVLGIVILAAAMIIAIAVVALVVAAVAVVIALAIATVAIIAGLAIVLVAVVLAVALIAAALLAVVAIALVAIIIALVFVVLAVAVAVVTIALLAFAVSILAVGLALVAGMGLIGMAFAIGAAALAYAVICGIAAIFGFAVYAVFELAAISIEAIGAFMALTCAFAGVLVLGLYGLIIGTIAALIGLFLIGMLLIGKSAEDVWEIIKPWSDKVKGWWDDIQEWWQGTFIKRILDEVDAAGGWMNWIYQLIDKAKNKLLGVFTNNPLSKKISELSDWWDKFSFKGCLISLWETVKNFMLKIWNKLIDKAAAFSITYPSDLDIEIQWMGPVPYPSVSISTDEWHPFSFMGSWKASVKEDKPAQLDSPAESLEQQDNARATELEQEIELTDEEKRNATAGASNVFEWRNRINEALRKKREARAADKNKVVPQYMIYNDQPGWGGGGSSGLYSNTLGSGL